jgi:hypothetical protein
VVTSSTGWPVRGVIRRAATGSVAHCCMISGGHRGAVAGVIGGRTTGRCGVIHGSMSRVIGRRGGCGFRRVPTMLVTATNLDTLGSSIAVCGGTL